MYSRDTSCLWRTAPWNLKLKCDWKHFVSTTPRLARWEQCEVSHVWIRFAHMIDRWIICFFFQFYCSSRPSIKKKFSRHAAVMKDIIFLVKSHFICTVYVLNYRESRWVGSCWLGCGIADSMRNTYWYGIEAEYLRTQLYGIEAEDQCTNRYERNKPALEKNG